MTLKTKSDKNIFTWLNSIQERPEVFLRDYLLYEIEYLVWGYCSALSRHGIVENVPAMDRHFVSWMNYHTKNNAPQGWAFLIEKHLKEGEGAVDGFFRVAREYSLLKPKCLHSLQLKDKHRPVGAGCRVGPDSFIEKPDRISIFQYRPEPIHFLRYDYPDRTENGPIITMPGLNEKTTVEDAKKWALDTFLIEPEEWGGSSIYSSNS